MIWFLILIKRLFLSGLWLGVPSRTYIKKEKCLQKIGLSTQNIITTLGSTFNISREALYDHLMSGT